MSRLAAAAGGYQALLGAEAEQSGRYRHPEDAAAFLASRALLRLLAAHLLAVPPDQAAALQVTRHCPSCGGTDHGKPQVAGLEVSLSRTRTMVLAAAGPAGIRLGADVELVPEEVFEGFDQTVLSPAERRRTGRGRAGTLDRMRLWTAKEAALKATGHGLTVEPVQLSVEPAGAGTDQPFSARTVCPSVPELDGLHVGWVPAGEHHLAALASSAALPLAPQQASGLLASAAGLK
ncbi:4'-phosphopantetheinyl transferase superfamily protein [Arthrobacter sp. I2-34]|uniref:4'-phosphopantetheinyl transferase superfamily protein n=1 Tax=Arthrobacter hankyongi TaxID=2904801 RepID=A0ABS9LC87_9MICC|nr:4'-phosphopantetheinyl transferase superfamily protein [Arthrobacter hankyongi]MCG2624302.1 4'-phosphopantetheinyl transferase superfamily protein [Arthrobacter hankyongi]